MFTIERVEESAVHCSGLTTLLASVPSVVPPVVSLTVLPWSLACPRLHDVAVGYLDAIVDNTMSRFMCATPPSRAPRLLHRLRKMDAGAEARAVAEQLSQKVGEWAAHFRWSDRSVGACIKHLNRHAGGLLFSRDRYDMHVFYVATTDRKPFVAASVHRHTPFRQIQWDTDVGLPVYTTGFYAVPTNKIRVRLDDDFDVARVEGVGAGAQHSVHTRLGIVMRGLWHAVFHEPGEPLKHLLSTVRPQLRVLRWAAHEDRRVYLAH
jgi:hypothetical protein